MKSHPALSTTRFFCTCFLLALLLAPLARAGDSAPRAPSTATHFSVPCKLDGSELGEIDGLFTSSNGLITIDGVALVDWLQPVVIPETLTKLQHALDADKRLTPSAVAAAGLGLEYDSAALEIVLSVPAELRQKVELRLGSVGPRREVVPPISSAPMSGYVNLRAGREYVNAEGHGVSGWQPVVMDLDGAMNIENTAVEGVASYRGGAWSRGDVRLVRDFPQDRLRVTAGDIGYNLDGFQTFQRAGGITLGRNFGLQPYRSSAPSGLTTVLLDRRSNVDILVNGQRMESLNLGPGQYNVRDFPFAAGANDVALRVTDDVGRVQVINFPFVYDSTVLGAGEQDFQYAFGFAARATQDGRAYATDKPLGSLYHAIGLTDQVTVGLNLQASTDVKTGGVETRWATSVGTLRLDLSGSVVQGVADGYAARLTYRYVDTINPHSTGRSIEFSGIYRSPTFATLGAFPAANPVAADLGVRYGQRIIGNIYGSAGFSYQKGRMGTRDSHEADLSLSTTLWKNVSAYVLASRSQPSFGAAQSRIFIAISWFPQGHGYSATATEDTHARNTQLQFHYAPDHVADAFEGDATVERNPTQTSLRGEAEYTGYRFTAGVTQNSTIDQTGSGLTQHQTNITVGSALAFADGHFGISRPIDDSFVIVRPHPSLAGHSVEVNPFATVPDAKTDFLGNAVLPNLISYYRYQVLLAAEDLPEGLDLGRDFYVVEPRYRSGAVIQAGTGATVLLEALLLDKAAQPLGLELGTIAQDDFPNEARIDFFTNRDGRLRVAGLRPGRVTIELANYPEAPIHLTIPAKVTGHYNAGQATLDIEPEPTARPQTPKSDGRDGEQPVEQTPETTK